MVRLKPGGQTKQKGLGDRPLSRGTLTCVPPGPGHLRKQVGPASEPLSRAGVDPTHSSNAGPKPLLGTQICEAKGRLSVPPRLAALRFLPPLLVSGNGTGRQPRPLGNSVTSPRHGHSPGLGRCRSPLSAGDVRRPGRWPWPADWREAGPLFKHR